MPVLYALLLWQGVPEVNNDFWKLLLISVPAELIVGVTFFFAIKLTPLSLVLPFTTLGTVFIALGAFVINNEPLKPIYVIAFPLILIGAYFIQEKHSINWRNLHNQKTELGIILMVFSTMLFGINIPIGRLMSEASSAFFYLSVNFSLFIFFFTPIFLRMTNTTFRHMRQRGRALLLIGLFNGAFLGSLWLALTKGPAGPVSAINNLSILVAIMLAGTQLKEKGVIRRLAASLIMISGATLAILA